MCVTVFYVLLFIIFSNCEVYHRYFVKNPKERSSLCNDGTTPIYFANFNPSSTKWLVFLEGGGGCYSVESCKDRFKTAHFLMTSDGYNETIKLEGILSSDCSVNPAFCKANKVFIHYCTSDWWNGNASASEKTGNFHFYGHYVPLTVVEDLISDHGLKKASQVVLSGSSAGGVGTWVNADIIGNYIQKQIPSVDYRVASDCGWFLDGKPLKEWDCTTQAVCSFEHRVKYGAEMWNLHHCYEDVEPWECLVGYRMYPYIKSKKFGIFYHFDWWQAIQDGISKRKITDLTKEERDWVNNRGNFVQEIIRALKMEENGVFALGCFLHGIVGSTSLYSDMKALDGYTLNHALDDWINGKESHHVDKCTDVACNKNCHSMDVSEMKKLTNL